MTRTAKSNLGKNFQKVEQYLIGLWRFNRRNEEKLWCATFVYDGEYYDVEGFTCPNKTLDRVRIEIELLIKENEA